MRKRINQRKSKNYTLLFALIVATLTVGYATFAQPLAHKLDVLLPDNSRFGPWVRPNSDDNSNKGSDSNKNNNGNYTNYNNGNGTSESDIASNINNNPTVDTVWNVGFVGAKKESSTGNARESEAVTFDQFHAYFYISLYGPGDSFTYEFTIKNKGSLDAKVNKVEAVATYNNDLIIFSIIGINEGDILKAGQTAKVLVTVSYNNSYTTLPATRNEKMVFSINYVQNS